MMLTRLLPDAGGSGGYRVIPHVRGVGVLLATAMGLVPDGGGVNIAAVHSGVGETAALPRAVAMDLARMGAIVTGSLLRLAGAAVLVLVVTVTVFITVVDVVVVLVLFAVGVVFITVVDVVVVLVLFAVGVVFITVVDVVVVLVLFAVGVVFITVVDVVVVLVLFAVGVVFITPVDAAVVLVLVVTVTVLARLIPVPTTVLMLARPVTVPTTVLVPAKIIAVLRPLLGALFGASKLEVNKPFDTDCIRHFVIPPRGRPSFRATSELTLGPLPVVSLCACCGCDQSASELGTIDRSQGMHS